MVVRVVVIGGQRVVYDCSAVMTVMVVISVGVGIMIEG